MTTFDRWQAQRASEAESQRSLRQSRKDNGERRVEAWISPKSADYLDRLKAMTGRTTSEVIDYAIDAMGYANLKGER